MLYFHIGSICYILLNCFTFVPLLFLWYYHRLYSLWCIHHMLLVYCALSDLWIWHIIQCLGIILDLKGDAFIEVPLADEYGGDRSIRRSSQRLESQYQGHEWFLFWVSSDFCSEQGGIIHLILYYYTLRFRSDCCPALFASYSIDTFIASAIIW